MISQRARYAFKALFRLSQGHAGQPLQIRDIAVAESIPQPFLEQILLDLKRAGLVKSTRGPRGGYRLGRAPAEISFGDVVRVMEGPIALVPCASVNFYERCGDCHDEATCAIRRAFGIVRDQTASILDDISLAQGANWEIATPE